MSGQRLLAANGMDAPDAAALYLELGLAVLPVEAGAKRPAAGASAKLAMHGAERAERVRGWFSDNPGLNIALAPAMSHLAVLDLDRKTPEQAAAADAAAAVLRGEGLLNGLLAVSATPSGGHHLWFRYPADGRGGRVDRAGSLELKARGSYVLEAPSSVPDPEADWRSSGGGSVTWGEMSASLHYEWLWATEAAEWDGGPQFRLAEAREALGFRAGRWERGEGWEGGGGGLEPLVRAVAGAREGERNSLLFWAACRAASEDCEDWHGQLEAAAVRAGLGRAEVRRTLDSAARTVREEREPA